MDACLRWIYWAGYRVLRAYWYLRRPRSSGSVVALWSGGRVLVVWTSYRRLASLPAGSRRRGEDPADTAVRELREEVGVRVAPQQLRFVRTVVHRSDYKHDDAHVFELVLEPAPRIEPDRREVVDARWLTLDEALALPLTTPARVYLEAARSAGAPQLPSSS